VRGKAGVIERRGEPSFGRWRYRETKRGVRSGASGVKERGEYQRGR